MKKIAPVKFEVVPIQLEMLLFVGKNSKCMAEYGIKSPDELFDWDTSDSPTARIQTCSIVDWCERAKHIKEMWFLPIIFLPAEEWEFRNNAPSGSIVCLLETNTHYIHEVLRSPRFEVIRAWKSVLRGNNYSHIDWPNLNFVGNFGIAFMNWLPRLRENDQKELWPPKVYEFKELSYLGEDQTYGEYREVFAWKRWPAGWFERKRREDGSFQLVGCGVCKYATQVGYIKLPKPSEVISPTI